MLSRVKWWFWVVIVAAAVVGGLLARILYKMFAKVPASTESSVGILPPVPPILQERMDKAREEVLVAKATSKAVTETKTQELNEITKISDGKERRSRLAAFVKTV